MRQGEMDTRSALIFAAKQVINCPIGAGVGVDESQLDRDLLEAAKNYVNAVVGPNISGDRI